MRINRLYGLYLAITLSITALAVLITAVRGLNLGIDFTGGALLERGFEGQVTVADVQRVLASEALADLNLGRSVIQPLGSGTPAQSVLLIRTGPLEQAEVERIDAALGEAFGKVDVRRTDLVGPVIGAELVRKAIWAVALSVAAILAYIAVRFEFRFGIAAAISLAHDVFVTLAVFALLHIEVNTPFVAAMLTVAGYSINDTIIVFDRIRENLRNRRRDDVGVVVTDSVNQTLVRSLYTSTTTMLAALAIFLFGGVSLRPFMLALIIGIAAGTYSSIFLASPLWYAWRRFEQGRRLAHSH
ncbi:MAG TPA: protein translocase subunit SecF [Limnochordia bacterium]